MPTNQGGPISGRRRRLILGAAAAVSGPLSTPRARAAGAARLEPEAVRVAQWLDASPDQQEISRDYATGVRLAVNSFNLSNRRRIQLVGLESDGTPTSIQSVIKTLRTDTSLCALLGTAGERLALASIETAQDAGLAIPHLAPWLFDSRHDVHRQVLSVFASRTAQIRYAFKSLESLGVVDIGLVYANEREFQSLREGVEAAATELKLRTVSYSPVASEGAASLAGKLSARSPAVLLYLGGTLELSLFAHALSERKLQRYIVSLADVDANALLQFGIAPRVPMILTQIVPNPQTSNLPAVLAYRESLKVQFDERPSPISLAGYLAARYVLGLFARIERAPTRELVQVEVDRRPAQDIGGFRIGFTPSQRRGSSFVTQTLLTEDGRLIG